MARAMAEMFRDEPDSPLPEPLAALLRQTERWRKEQGKHDG
jgi:TorA maturation chaperone TorD